MDADHYQEQTRATAIYNEQVGKPPVSKERVQELLVAVDKATNAYYYDGLDKADAADLTKVLEWSLTIQREFTLLYTIFGLVGEVGEIAEKVKKNMRAGNMPSKLIGDEGLKKEFGDAPWYLARGAEDYGFKLSEVLQANLDKLADRRERGVIHGTGDNR